MSRAEILPALPYRSQIRETDQIAAVHNHTSESDGFFTPEGIVEGALEAGINVLIITDHDTYRGGVLAKEYAHQSGYIRKSNDPETHFEVHEGIELTTKKNDTYAHLLAFWPEDRDICIPRFLTPEETAHLAKENGAIVIAPHPDSEMTIGLSWEEIQNLRDQGVLDAIEYNGAEETVSYLRYWLDLPFVPFKNLIKRKILPGQNGNSPNLQAIKRSKSLDLPVVGGEDTHRDRSEDLVRVCTLFPKGMTLENAITSGEVVFHSKFNPEVWNPLDLRRQKKLSRGLEERRQNGTLV